MTPSRTFSCHCPGFAPLCCDNQTEKILFLTTELKYFFFIKVVCIYSSLKVRGYAVDA